MMHKPVIRARLTLLPTSEGGRETPLDLGMNYYRPHIVIGDASQRKAILKNGSYIDEKYLGVQFVPRPQVINLGETVEVEMTLAFYPKLRYEEVVPGTEYTVREGAKIVGYGTVLERFDNNDVA